MGEIGDVLELLHGARCRYRSVRGVLRNRVDPQVAGRARRRHEEEPTRFPPRVPQRERTETLIRFWSEAPSRVREEITRSSGSCVDAVGALGPAGGDPLWTSLVDAADWIPGFHFHVDGEAELIGRRALRVGAVPRRPHRPPYVPFVLEQTQGADAYELLVDRERGVVLRVAALLEGEEFWTSEFEELAFDEAPPEERFVFEEPPRVGARAPDAPSIEPVTVE